MLYLVKLQGQIINLANVREVELILDPLNSEKRLIITFTNTVNYTGHTDSATAESIVLPYTPEVQAFYRWLETACLWRYQDQRELKGTVTADGTLTPTDPSS